MTNHAVSYARNNISTNTTAAFTAIVSFDTNADPVMPNDSSGNISWRAAAFSNPVGEQCSLNGVVAVRKDSMGVITLDSGGGSGGFGPTDRQQTGGIVNGTPLIEVVESSGVVTVQAKSMQTPGTPNTYNAPSEYVLLSGTHYRCVQSHSSVQQPPNATYWVLFPFQGSYSVNSSYNPNDWVNYSGQYWYTTVAVPSGPGNEPGTSASWIIAVDAGTWNAGTSATDLLTDVVARATFERTHNS